MIKTENPFARYLKSISDINLGRFLERQENALRSLEGIGYADNPPEGSYITAVRENLEILYAEKERRENFREYIDWNDPKDLPTHNKALLGRLFWENDNIRTFQEVRWMTEVKSWWIRRHNAWIKPGVWKFKNVAVVVEAWTEMPQGPKGSFSTKQKKKEVYMGALDEKMK